MIIVVLAQYLDQNFEILNSSNKNRNPWHKKVNKFQKNKLHTLSPHQFHCQSFGKE